VLQSFVGKDEGLGKPKRNWGFAAIRKASPLVERREEVVIYLGPAPTGLWQVMLVVPALGSQVSLDWMCIKARVVRSEAWCEPCPRTVVLKMCSLTSILASVGTC
jgi:hypothetical protein